MVKNGEKQLEHNNEKVLCKSFPGRWVLAVMSFFGTFNVYSLRVNLSAAIVAMIDYDGLEQLYKLELNKTTTNLTNMEQNLTISTKSYENNSTQNTKCGETFIQEDVDGLTNTNGEFLWNENMQGLALGAYFYGYVWAQIFGAWVGRKLSRVRVWGISIFVASFITVLIPFIIQLGLGAFVGARALIGLFSGVSYPIMHGIWSMWAPPTERSKLLTVQFAGAPFGTVVVLPISGVLAKEFGWQSVFYFTGTIGLIWSVMWLFLIHDSPSQHPRITEKEKKFIETSLGYHSSEDSRRSRKISVPWLSMFKSMAMWSTIVPHFSTNFTIIIFLTMLPTYLRTMLNFDVKASGALSSIPYIVKMIMFPIAGFTADYFIKRGIRTVYIRKIWSLIGLVIPGTGLILAAYTGCDIGLIIFLFAISVGMDTFTVPGFKASMLEIAPAFGGIIFAIANTIGTSSGFIAPQLAGALREANRDNPTRGWMMLFWLAAIIHFTGALFFLIFGTSDIQPWAKPIEEKKNETTAV